MENAIVAIAVTVSLGASGCCQLKAPHRIEEKLGKLVNLMKGGGLDG